MDHSLTEKMVYTQRGARLLSVEPTLWPILRCIAEIFGKGGAIPICKAVRLIGQPDGSDHFSQRFNLLLAGQRF
jgi:hypothetical protein